MKTFRSIVILLVVLALGAAALPAMGQSDSPITLPDQIAEGRDVTIGVTACIGDDQTDVRAQWDEQIARFEALYPNVTVETLIYCFGAESFPALVAGGELPTLFGVPLTEPGKLISQGIVQDLTPYFEQYGLTDIFSPSVLGVVSDADGNIYGIPNSAYAQGIAYNVQWLQDAGYDHAPQTWAELAEMADALADQDNLKAGFAMNMSGGGGGWHFTNIAYGFGADIIVQNEDGTYTATFGEGPAVDAMQFVYDLRWTYDVLPYDLSINPILELVADNTAMAMNPGDGLGWVNLNMPEVDLSKYAYAPVPAGPDGVRRSLTGGEAYFINATADADQTEAAIVFHLWRKFSSDELAAERAIFNSTQAGQGAPVLNLYVGDFAAQVAAIDADFVTMPVENYAAFNDAIAAGEVELVPEPIVAAQDFYTAISEVLTTVLTDENADVPQLMADAAASFQTGILDQLAPAE
ncbi:MAG TPA: extracellular solute-binding protein [Aggregatilinea sp.]|uniref:extracellular solute-binding protein n=1 Tax=Aggregatilinea sp. TaxID=2806333 RepID=UPI002B7D93A1|nr:extracellular solute-binding protein [Aggregatilinea sp.]HML21416.1 extracellular solute-binding protein [Aggregatilinea sp.]